MIENLNNVVEIKISILGSSGVGKTCLVNRFINGTFDLFSKTTPGVNYFKKELILGNNKINLDIWDTAGQEKYYSLGKNFYRNADIIIIVYDISNIKSFEEIKKHWYKDVKENGEKYKVIGIVGNKIDLFDMKGINEIDDKIIKEFIEEISNNNKNCRFMNKKVSAKSGVNIKPLFNELVEEFFKAKNSKEKLDELSLDISSFKPKRVENEIYKKKCC